jgi:hypothetical protein
MERIKDILENLTAEEVDQLVEELEKRLKFVEKEWPQEGDRYYFVSASGDIGALNFCGDACDQWNAQMGNLFRTKEEAEWYKEHLKVCAELRRMADGSVNDHVFIYMHDGYIESPYIFASDESAQKAIDTIGEERLKKYWFRGRFEQ